MLPQQHARMVMKRRELLRTLGAGLVGVTAARAVGTPTGLVKTAGAQTAGADLSRFQWRRRLLVVFAPVPQDPRLAAQRLRLAEQRSGYAERDLTVIEVAGRSVLVDGARDRSLDSYELRVHFEIEDNAFATLLIGKDGGEKLRRDGLMPNDMLFDAIDTMPMRRQEMGNQ
jgi:hypothetical protein